ncbi:MAG: ABC transporter ATP-binding protein [Sneathiella sp.]|uniref:ABC transporter ATP-binding protein n=1 Tax=Sneathiella sp. TaxID=1964365 RepID=UPI0030039747
MEQSEIVLKVDQITKRFGNLAANDGITFELERGKVLSLLGENGAGKTTLMNIIFGHYTADEGRIEAFGKELNARSPAEAIGLGIGMVHQHFTLAENLTVLDNIILGTEKLWHLTQSKTNARKHLARLSSEFGLKVDPDAMVSSLSVGERQRVEILKALYRDAQILILDEPTAVLTPQETDQLFATLRDMVAKGLSIIFISHKLNEVLAIADDIVVLRHGKLVASFPAATASRELIAEKMVGQSIPQPKRTKFSPGAPLVEMTSVQILNHEKRAVLDVVNLTVRQNEIVGIAGVSGNGQKLLSDVIAGLASPTSGSIVMKGELVTQFSPRAMVQKGVGRVPEDRHEQGVVGDFTVSENMVLENYQTPGFSKFGLLKLKTIFKHAEALIKTFDIRGADPDTIVRGLSGGNMQKVILSRVLEGQPEIIVANQPTRGLDVGAATFVHEQLFDAREKGAGIIVISEDLEELLAVSDVIVVMYHGQVSQPISVDNVALQELGLLMSGEGFVSDSEESRDVA